MRLPVPTLHAPAHDRVVALLVALGAMGFAGLMGIAIARSPGIGMAIGLGALFAAIAAIYLPIAIAIWTATLFLQLVPGIGLATTLASIVIVIAWTGRTAARPESIRRAVAQVRGTAIAVGALLVYLAASLAWADDAPLAQEQLLSYALAVVLFFVVATSLDTIERFRMITGGYVLGAAIVVVVGIVSGDLGASAGSAIETSTEGRLTTGGNDPNELASGLVPAIALAAGLAAGARGPRRLMLLLTIPLLIVGVAATQSRGGLIAAAVALIASVVVARGRRTQVVGIGVLVAAVAAFALATTPGALDRITSADNGGNGRTDLWTIAVRMWQDHPVFGVGLAQFPGESKAYVQDPGSLEFVELIAEKPHLVHNTYLQLLAEVGVLGLLLYLLVAALCVAAAWRAARMFSASGQRSAAALAQAVVVAEMARLAAIGFLSVGADYRTWLPLALGPAILGIALRSTRASVGRIDG